MPSRLQDEIRQTKPFASLEQEASLSIERTAVALRHSTAEALKPFGITPVQYNVLRILRGAGAGGLCRNEIADRLVTQMPDVTRLLDRMEGTGLITRERSTEDRRLVTTRLTATGRELVNRLDEPMAQLHRQQLGHLGDDELRRLIELLAAAREPR